MKMNKKRRWTADAEEVKDHSFWPRLLFLAPCHSLAYEDEGRNEEGEDRDVGDASCSPRLGDQNGHYGHNGDEGSPRLGFAEHLLNGQNHAVYLHYLPFAAGESPFWSHCQDSCCSLHVHP